MPSRPPSNQGHATIALTVTQRPPCESMQIPKDNLKPKGLREAKETNRSLLRHNIIKH